MKDFFKELGIEIVSVSTTLFKILIPVIIVVKLLNMLGATTYLSALLAPVMSLVGLPETVGIVWATTLMTNIYAGMLVYANLGVHDSLSVAQVTVMASMMLVAHGLPIEGTIAKKAGVNSWLNLLVRIGGALFYGWSLHKLYSSAGWLQQPAQMAWQPSGAQDSSLPAWAIAQIKSLGLVFIIIIVLLFCLKVLKTLGIERVMAWLLQPILRLLGIGREATTISIVGITLGLSYGGGLLINEAKKGTVAPRDVATAILMLGLLHSVIEDTLLLLLLGADLSGILWGRLILTFVIIGLISRLMNALGETRCRRYFYKPVHARFEKG